MKPHHAAVLVLIGWYLLQPPTHREAGGKVVFDGDLPLSLWRHISSYDTAKECQAQIEHMWELPPMMVEIEGADFVRCIASDDPRLKGK